MKKTSSLLLIFLFTILLAGCSFDKETKETSIDEYKNWLTLAHNNTFRDDDLQLNKVEINMATNNIKSKAISERLGLKEEGRIRNHEFLHGEYLDRTTFGLLKDEWLHR